MPKVKPLGSQTEANFGAILKSAMIRSRLKPQDIAKKTRRSERTVAKRFLEPGEMTLSELKLYIKATNLEKEDVIEYLYSK